MEPNPYEAPDVPSDAPRDAPSVVVIPSWVVMVAIAIAIAGTLIALFSPPIQMR